VPTRVKSRDVVKNRILPRSFNLESVPWDGLRPFWDGSSGETPGKRPRRRAEGARRRARKLRVTARSRVDSPRDEPVRRTLAARRTAGGAGWGVRCEVRLETGLKAHEWLCRLRQLDGLFLIWEGWTIESAAAWLQYPRECHFRRDFKEVYGMTPAAAPRCGMSPRAVLRSRPLGLYAPCAAPSITPNSNAFLTPAVVPENHRPVPPQKNRRCAQSSARRRLKVSGFQCPAPRAESVSGCASRSVPLSCGGQMSHAGNRKFPRP
jgi:AraC-like DNA-binding protein